LGSDQESWRVYDASELVLTAAYKRPILIDQGTADPYLEEHLLPKMFEQACEKAGQPLTLRFQEGYNHNYTSSPPLLKTISAITLPLFVRLNVEQLL
jgi:S-formylglutathione hydrolase